MLYYSIAHYYDVRSSKEKTKYENIKNHIYQFNNLNIADKEFIIVTAVDTPREDVARYIDVKKHLYNFCKKIIPNHTVHILVEYNWGGTIAALWNTYLLIETLPKHGYIAHFEEDFISKNTTWYNKAIELLNDDTIYVGESNKGRIKTKNDDNRLSSPLYHTQQRLGDPEVWTDGGFYFSSKDKLRQVKEKIGIFHKGDINKKYDRTRDGISLGEVGFPTLLHHNNFKFSVLNRNDYFTHE